MQQSLQRSINSEINNLFSSEFNYNYRDIYGKNPCVSFAFKHRDSIILSSSAVLENLSQVDLSLNSKPSELLLFNQELNENLSSKEEVKKGEYRYISKLFVVGKTPFSYVSVGMSPDNVYSDDGMYKIDDFGVEILKLALRRDLNPVFFKSNYNFCQVPHDEIRLFSSGFSSLLQKIKSEANS